MCPSALAESKKFVPLDADGKPSPSGKIVLLSIVWLKQARA